jgi:hypothetical protein
MRVFPHVAGWLTCLVFSSAVHASPTPDPLRLVPDIADLAVKIEQPRRLVESVLHNSHFQQFQTLDPVREFYDSTNARRFYQFLAYFENQFGADRMELLDRLAGGGIVLGAKVGPQPAPSVLVIQAKDEALLRRFFKLGLSLIEQELARQESKEKIAKGNHRGVDVWHIGKDFFTALAGSALLVSNVEKGMQLALDLHLDGGKKSLSQVANIAAGRDLAGPDPLAWLWLNMETVHKAPQAKDVFTLPRNDVNLTVLFGGLLDVAGRSPYLCVGLYAKDQDYTLSLRMPRGREGMPTALAPHVPPAGQPGSRPLLEPKGVLFSTSFYLDISKFWEYRDKLFNSKQMKAFEDFDKQARPALAGNQFSKLAAMAGGYLRFVVTNQPKSSYKVSAGVPSPAYALVVEMREPATFSKKMDGILRAAALLATTQIKLKAAEEAYHGHTIVGYRFPEDVAVKGDVGNYRFNFSPCFVAVGNQFAACSTFELGREMVDLLEKEAKGGSNPGSPATMHSLAFSTGGAQLLETYKDRLYTRAMLDQAVAPDQATKQVESFLDLVRRLGVLEIEENYGEREFRYEWRLKLGKPSAGKETAKQVRK